jgi:hypothetical protein
LGLAWESAISVAAAGQLSSIVASAVLILGTFFSNEIVGLLGLPVVLARGYRGEGT